MLLSVSWQRLIVSVLEVLAGAVLWFWRFGDSIARVPPALKLIWELALTSYCYLVDLKRNRHWLTFPHPTHHLALWCVSLRNFLKHTGVCPYFFVLGFFGVLAFGGFTLWWVLIGRVLSDVFAEAILLYIIIAIV
jgi:hypothetical protein